MLLDRMKYRTESIKWDQRLINRKLNAVTHLLILQFNSNYPEGVRGCVVVYVDSAESLLSRFDWHPFLTGIVIDHNWSPGLANTLFTREWKQQNQAKKPSSALAKTPKGKETDRNYQNYSQHTFCKRFANAFNAICLLHWSWHIRVHGLNSDMLLFWTDKLFHVKALGPEE